MTIGSPVRGLGRLLGWLRRPAAFTSMVLLIVITTGTGDRQTAAADSDGPSPPGGSTAERSVIGSDGRVPVHDSTLYPYSAIAEIQLFTDSGDLAGTCTGTLIGPDVVLTAGHCLWDPTTARWALHVRVIPGKNGVLEPFGSEFATAWWVPDAYIESHGDAEFDWGVIRLPNDLLTRQARWMPVAVLDDETLADHSLVPAIAGSPADRPDGTMWVDLANAFATIDATALWYAIDTEAGESGAAIWATGPASPYLGLVIGIHRYGAQDARGLNDGARMTPALVADLEDACSQLGCTLDVVDPATRGPSSPPFQTTIAGVARD